MIKPEITGREVVAAGKFLNFSVLTFRDDKGRIRKWEAAGRENSHGAVMIIARIVPDDKIILVRQFRPPAGKYLIEFPAGLMDKEGESIDDTAMRELYEETGYEGNLVDILPPGYSSPGLSGETIAAAVMEIDGDRYRENPPEAHPEESESIECFAVKKSELKSFLNQAIANGDGVDTKILIYSMLC